MAFVSPFEHLARYIHCPVFTLLPHRKQARLGKASGIPLTWISSIFSICSHGVVGLGFCI